MESLVRPELRKDQYAPAANLAVNEVIKKRIASGENIINFILGQSPFPIPSHAVAALRDNAHQKAYLPVDGLKELREQICQFHSTQLGQTHFDPDRVIVGTGSKQLIYLTLSVFNGDIFIVSPSWLTYRPQTQVIGNIAKMISNEEKDGWKLLPSALEKAINEHGQQDNRILIICNPDNPTGACYTPQEMMDLTVVFRKYNITLLSDEIYACTHYELKFKSFSQFYPEGTIVTSGLSKWCGAGGWRVGYAMFPDQLSSIHDIVKRVASHTYSCCPAPMQYAAIGLFADTEKCSEYNIHICRIMKTIADYAVRELRAAHITVATPSAGFYLFVSFEALRDWLSRQGGPVTGPALCSRILEECGVAICSAGPDFLRPINELTARLAIIDFDGDRALAESMRRGVDSPLDDAFVKEFCCRTYDGIRRLVVWATPKAGK